MAAADTPNSVSASQAEQLTAPPGWIKKLVPAKAKYITLRKLDVVFVAPDGKEIPSQWHLRRYLKAHPEGPAFSEFNWSSGEESVRRSARASAKEVSYSERPTPRSKGKRNAAEMDVEGAEEDNAKTPARKRAKKAGNGDSSVVKDSIVSPDKDVVTHEVPEGAGAVGEVKDTIPEAAVPKNDVGVDNAKEEQAAAQDPVNLTSGAILVEQEVEEVIGQVVVVKEHALEVKEQMDEVVFTANEPLEDVEAIGASEVSLLVTPSNEVKGEELVVESKKPLESSDASVVELKEPLDQILKVREDVHNGMKEHHEGEKVSLEPLMQKEEQERLPSVHNSPRKVEHVKEKSPNELSSSQVPVSVTYQ